jgi:hypothetical protein
MHSVNGPCCRDVSKASSGSPPDKPFRGKQSWRLPGLAGSAGPTASDAGESHDDRERREPPMGASTKRWRLRAGHPDATVWRKRRMTCGVGLSTVIAFGRTRGLLALRR